MLVAYVFRTSQRFLYANEYRAITTIAFVEEAPNERNLVQAISLGRKHPVIAKLMTNGRWREERLVKISRHVIVPGMSFDNLP